VTLRPKLFELVLNVMLRSLTGVPGHGDDVRRIQEIIEETFAVSGAPALGTSTRRCGGSTVYAASMRL
jgi:hypothetical protein